MDKIRVLAVNHKKESMKAEKLVCWEYALTESRCQKQEDLGFEKSPRWVSQPEDLDTKFKPRTAYLPEP